MGLLRKLGARVVERVLGASRPGEAAPAPRSEPPRPAAPPPTAARPAPATPDARFPEECQPADLDRLVAALGPGPRPRVVNHWATWCEPCVEEIPLLVAVHLQVEDRADFLGVCWELFDDQGDPAEVASRVADFASARAVRYPSLLVTAQPEAMFERLGLRSRKIPQTWLVAPDGQIVWRLEGVLDEATAAELVARITGG